MPSGRQATPGLFPHPRPPGEGSDPTPPPTTTILYLQGVPKLMAPPSSCNNKKTRKVLFMVAWLIKLPHFSTQALTCSGIPHIRLSSTFAEMLRRAERTFYTRVASEVGRPILLALSWTIAHRFSMGDRSGLLPSHTPFAQKAGKLS